MTETGSRHWWFWWNILCFFFLLEYDFSMLIYILFR